MLVFSENSRDDEKYEPENEVVTTEVDLKTVFCYGVGHFLNDMTAACWFNYLLVFLIQVTDHSPWAAGIVMLSGQIGDAIATPLVGIFSDRSTSPFGRRKTWLAGGAILVNICFFFVFSDCYPCVYFKLNDSSWVHVFYWAFLGAAFNFGWAAVQVSHMALVPEISHDEHERVRLNSARYAGGIVATLLVLGIAWASFQRFGVSSKAFKIIAISSIAIGDFFTIIFLIGVRENPPQVISSRRLTSTQKNLRESRTTWYSWFKERMFYQVAMVYMCSRITVNMSQIFMPFYLQFYLNLTGDRSTVIAEVPLVVMVTSFTTTFFLKRLNKLVGRRTAYSAGGVFVFGGLAGLYFMPLDEWYLIYALAVLLGVGTTTVLVTSVSMEADLVGQSVQSGAFVYGALSFTDKLSNGILIQITSQYSTQGSLVRQIIVWIPGVACLLAILTTFTITEYYRKTSSPKGSVAEYEPLIATPRRGEIPNVTVQSEQ